METDLRVFAMDWYLGELCGFQYAVTNIIGGGGVCALLPPFVDYCEGICL